MSDNTNINHVNIDDAKVNNVNKIAETNVSVSKILHDDNLRRVADKIISGDIERVVIIYRDKKDKRVDFDTTIDNYAEILGMMDIGMSLVNCIVFNDDADQG